MKRYLQRLAERAEGVSGTPSLKPALRSEANREAGLDSLPDAADGPFAESSKTLEEPLHTQPLQSSNRVEPRPQVLASMLDGVPMGSAGSPDPVETRSDPATIRRSSLDADETAVSQHLEPRKELVFPEKSVDNRRSARGWQPSQRHGPPASIARASRPPVPRADIDDETARRERTANTEEQQRSENLSGTVPQELLSPVHPTEHAGPAPNEKRGVAVDRDLPNLEPPPAEHSSPAVPFTDAPRLVIGQLRVDIVPTGPTATREVVRVVQRTAGAGWTLRPGPVSKLRFGLGQM